MFAGLIASAVLMLGQAQPAPSNFEHLKAFEPFIGTWVYEGPLLEDVGDTFKKGTKISIVVTYRWILDKNAVQAKIRADGEGGMKIEILGMNGWNAAEKKIIAGSMSSMGSCGMGEITFSEDGKTMTDKYRGVEANGDRISSTGIAILTDADTYVWQLKDRKGGTGTPESPKYTFKRKK